MDPFFHLEPTHPLLGLSQLVDVKLGHVMRGESSVGAEGVINRRAVVVHGEHELNSITKGENNALQSSKAHTLIIRTCELYASTASTKSPPL
jgi:hypothetical protein